MTALSLYSIASEYRAIADQLAQMDVDETTLADTLEAAAWPVEQKACAVAAVIGNLEAEADAYNEHAKRAAGVAKSIANRSKWLKKYLLENMQACNISEIKGGAITIKVKNNPEAVDVFQAELVPEHYTNTPPPPEKQIDKNAIKVAIKSGVDVPGARLVRGQRVEII